MQSEFWAPNFCSTKGVGATAPVLSGAKILDDGVIVPLGKPEEQEGPKVQNFDYLLVYEWILFNNTNNETI